MDTYCSVEMYVLYTLPHKVLEPCCTVSQSPSVSPWPAHSGPSARRQSAVCDPHQTDSTPLML